MKYTILISVLLVLCILSCDSNNKIHKTNHLLKNYKRAALIVLDKDNNEYDYAEVEFEDSGSLYARSENHGVLIPYEYILNDDTLSLWGNKYHITINENESVLLEGEKGDIIMYKLQFHEKEVGDEIIEPFYLRRCYYYVHLNIITTDEAIKYLTELKESYEQKSIYETPDNIK
jgi:hypothetical protein